METDYIEFTTIDTPAAERSKLAVGDIFINQAKCLACGWIIRSKNRHDYRSCKCGKLSIDGGSWYHKLVGSDLDTNAESHVVYYRHLHKDEDDEQ